MSASETRIMRQSHVVSTEEASREQQDWEHSHSAVSDNGFLTYTEEVVLIVVASLSLIAIFIILAICMCICLKHRKRKRNDSPSPFENIELPGPNFEERQSIQEEIGPRDDTPGHTFLGEIGQGHTLQGETGPGETIPGETCLGDTIPGETGLGDTIPGETGLGDTIPGESGLGDTIPIETGLGDTIPGETGLGDTIPGETGLGDTIPGETGLGDTIPGETGLGDTIPGESGLGDTIPIETGLGDTIPGETGPGDTIPESIDLGDVTRRNKTKSIHVHPSSQTLVKELFNADSEEDNNSSVRVEHDEDYENWITEVIRASGVYDNNIPILVFRRINSVTESGEPIYNDAASSGVYVPMNNFNSKMRADGGQFGDPVEGGSCSGAEDPQDTTCGGRSVGTSDIYINVDTPRNGDAERDSIIYEPSSGSWLNHNVLESSGRITFENPSDSDTSLRSNMTEHE